MLNTETSLGSSPPSPSEAGEEFRLFPLGRVNYILRLYAPHWRLEERLREIVVWCRETGARHVMLFTDPQYLAWNQLNQAEIDREVASLRRAKQAFDEAGLSLGINATYNMRVSRTDHRGHLDYDHWATCADGHCDYRTPCLLDPKLERYLAGYFGALASVGPDYIYVDDDHRYMLQGERGTWGCFCELHLLRFGERTGRAWTRTTLKEALRTDPAVRREWRAFLGERLVTLAGVMERAAHAVSSRTKVGMMVPCVHTLPALGHTLNNVLGALHPQTSPPLVRPCIGGYQDWRRHDLFAGLFYMEFIRHTLGDRIEYTPEIETTPGTRMAKSLAVTRFQIAQGLLNGMPNPAISAASYDGDSPFLEPELAPMLRANRPWFEALRRAAPTLGPRRGLQLRWAWDSPDHVPGALESVADLDWPAFTAAQILGQLGIPSTFADSPVRWLMGDSVRSLDDAEIRRLLGGGLLLDATAAAALGEMGYAEAVGCEVGSTLTGARGERLTDKALHGAYHQCLIPLRANRLDGVKRLRPLEGARAISEMVDDDLSAVAAGVTVFENRLGGRVAVLPYALHAQDQELRHFIRYHRREQFRRLLLWMAADAFPAWLATPTDTGVQMWESERTLTLCLTNLSFDIPEQLRLEFTGADWRADRGRYLDREGAWHPLADTASADGAGWTLRARLAPFDPLLLQFHRSRRGVEEP